MRLDLALLGEEHSIWSILGPPPDPTTPTGTEKLEVPGEVVPAGLRIF